MFVFTLNRSKNVMRIKSRKYSLPYTIEVKKKILYKSKTEQIKVMK